MNIKPGRMCNTAKVLQKNNNKKNTDNPIMQDLLGNTKKQPLTLFYFSSQLNGKFASVCSVSLVDKMETCIFIFESSQVISCAS